MIVPTVAAYCQSNGFPRVFPPRLPAARIKEPERG